MPTLPDPDPPLADDRIALRRWRPDDADALVQACNDPEIPRWTRVPHPYSAQDAAEFLELVRTGWEAATIAAFAIVRPDEHRRLCGSISLMHLEWEHGVGEIGYWTAADARRQGVASRATSLISRWGLGPVGLKRISLLTEPENFASQAVARRAGFHREGHLRSLREMHGDRRDFILYSLLPSDLAP